MKPLSADSIAARALTVLARAVCRHRSWFLYPQFVLFGLCVYYTQAHLQFDMSRDDLVGANKKYHRTYLAFKKEFPTQDDLVVVVESEDRERNRQFVERLGARLDAESVDREGPAARLRTGPLMPGETNLFRDVFYKGDLKMLGAKALQFVSEEDLRQLKDTLESFRPFIDQFTAASNLVSLFSLVNTQFRTAVREKNEQNDSLVRALPALERIVSQADDCLRRPGTPPSPGITALFDAGAEADQRMYITFSNTPIFLVTAQAPREELNNESVERLRTLVEQTKAEVPGLNVGLTGEPVLEHDEMAQSQKDTAVASIASLILSALIFIYGYQQTGRPIKATLCLIIGLGYTLAFATLAVGHLNILTITFVPILIGLAIDYGVHLISRYEEELRHGKPPEDALVKAMVYTGQGIFTGAFTTAGAFLAMWLTNFKGIQEMGVICGGGLLVCLVPMMTMLPVLLLRGRQNVIDHQQGDPVARRARIESLWLNRPRIVMVVTAVLCLLALTQIRRVYFDYNLLNMQSRGLPAVVYEQKLIDSTPKSVLYGAVIASNLQQAVQLEANLKKLPAVADVESMTQFLSEDQSHKLKLIDEIKQNLASVHFEEPDRSHVDLPELSRTLYSLGGYCGAAFDEVEKEDRSLARQLASLRQSIDQLRKDMLAGTDDQLKVNSLKLAKFQQALFDDLHETFQALQHQDTRDALRVQDLPAALRDRFVGVTGKYLLMVYPKRDLWQRDAQKEFIDQVQTLDPDVTGTPVQLYHYTELLKQSYEAAARYALAAIALLVFLHFRSPLSVALALMPVAIGFLWLGGSMGWLGVPLNPANIMVLPLVIGIGVTNGIHILNRYAEEQNPSILARSTGKAVLVSGLTTIAGFGSLILGQHRGIQSLGYVMAAGVALCMLAGLTFLPALLNLTGNRETKQPSVDNARSTLGREEPR
jgi:hopanoid biosynthesis associated RND transporter like protein HpnN